MPELPSWLVALLRTLIVICLPIALVLTNVRLMMSNAFLKFEYGKSDFPPEPYGFTQADRLTYAPIALAYLFNSEGIEFLGRQRFPEGQTAPTESCQYYTTRDCTYQYNDRELKHMADVKVVTRGAMAAWIVTGLIVIASAIVLGWRPETRPALRGGLVAGAVLTVGILLALVAYILINFNTFFVQFHKVFFEGESWLFLWSDTLIRLFPLQFWSDAFTLIGVGALAEGIVIGAGAWFGLAAK
ncbi:MAG: TIGR01906 family membrane protein [Chloroflexi bacterium]|nr:TIGR01906 family membrane protein [Chloroflexota bacterium]